MNTLNSKNKKRDIDCPLQSSYLPFSEVIFYCSTSQQLS